MPEQLLSVIDDSDDSCTDSDFIPNCSSTNSDIGMTPENIQEEENKTPLHSKDVTLSHATSGSQC
jgi:hypothetical protein